MTKGSDFLKMTIPSRANNCQCSKAKSCEQSQPYAAMVQGLLPSSWDIFVLLQTLDICIFKILILLKMMSFWKYNISAENDQILYDC